MKRLWTIQLLEFHSGNYKVVIEHHERGEVWSGFGTEASQAYANAEDGLIFKPGFIESSAIVRNAVRAALEKYLKDEASAS